MNLLRNRLIGPYLRQFSTNSPAIRSQILENLVSNIQYLVTVRQVRQPPRVKIIGVGNPLMGDDGVGIAAVERLTALGLPERVSVIDGGTGGMTLLHLMEGAEKMVFIDAVDMGRSPGSVVRLSGGEILDHGQAGAGGLCHAAGLVDVLSLARELGILPEVILYGVQIAAVDFCQGLTPGVEAALDVVMERVALEISGTVF